MPPPGAAARPPPSVPPPGSLGTTLAARQSVANQGAPLLPPSTPPSVQIGGVAQAGPVSRSPDVLRDELKQLEDEIALLEARRSPEAREHAALTRDPGTGLVDGMTAEERETEARLRAELKETQKELAWLESDSITSRLAKEGLPASLEAYEAKYSEARARLAQAEDDKAKVLLALTTLVGGEGKLSSILEQARLESPSGTPRAAAQQPLPPGTPGGGGGAGGAGPRRMSIDGRSVPAGTRSPMYEGMDLSTTVAAPQVQRGQPLAAIARQMQEQGTTRHVVRPFVPVVQPLAVFVPPGANTLPMPAAEAKGFQIGQQIVIGSGPTREVRTIVAFGSLVLDRPLNYAHHPGEQIQTVRPDGGVHVDASAVPAAGAAGVVSSTAYQLDPGTTIVTSTVAPPPPPTHRIEDEIDDEPPPPPPPVDTFWESRMRADRVKARARMRNWKVIEAKPAKHKRQWNQPAAVTIETNRKGYGRREQYRAQHRRNVNALLAQQRNGRRSRSPQSSSPRSRRPGRRSSPYGDDMSSSRFSDETGISSVEFAGMERLRNMNTRRDQVAFSSTAQRYRNGPSGRSARKDPYDRNDLVDATKRRQRMYEDLEDSRDRQRASQKKKQEIERWARQLVAVRNARSPPPPPGAVAPVGAGLSKSLRKPVDTESNAELMDILREAQGLPAGGGDGTLSSVGDGANAVYDEAGNVLMVSPRGQKLKRLPSGRVVQDRKTDAALGNYSKNARYGSTGVKCKSDLGRGSDVQWCPFVSQA